MISDEERREVAAMLRATKSECESRDYPWVVEDLLQALGFERYEDAEDGIFERLADLIDPTCRDLVEHKQDQFVPGKRSADGFFHCSACGWHGRIYEYVGFGDMMSYEAVCCPKCGKEIER